MNKHIVLVLCFFFGLITNSQTKEEVLRDAKITSKATLESQFETVLNYTYPPVLKIMGGKDKALSLVTDTMNTMKKQGFIFKSAEVLEVSEIVNEQNQYRCYVKTKNIMHINKMIITSISYLLGIYNTEGKLWYFIEAKQLSNPMMSSVLPNFKTSLNIPKGTVKTEEID